MRDDEAHILAKELANRLEKDQWMTWVEVVLGPVGRNAPRADLLAVNKSYTNCRFVIYEVKISKADFRSDVNSGKYRLYFPHCSQLYFACPSGIITKADLPDECGLIVKGPKGWSTTVAARRREFTPDVDLLLKLMMRGYEDYLPEWRQGERRKLADFKDYGELARSLGIKMAHDLATAEEFVAEADKMRIQINEALGEDNKSIYEAVWGLRHKIEELLKQHRYLDECLQLEHVASDLFRNQYDAGNAAEMLRTIAARIDEKYKAKREEDVDRSGG